MRAAGVVAGCVIAWSVSSGALAATTETAVQFRFQQDDTKGQLTAHMGDAHIFTYNYGDEWELPHFHPLNTPSGKNLLEQKTNPYPHHRSFWVSDTVVRNGVRGDIYNGYYSGAKAGSKVHEPPFNTAARHLEFEFTTGTPGMATIKEKLVWETQRTSTTYPLLDEHRDITLHALPDGQYLMDFKFSLDGAYGDVKFVSDEVHYSWPYLRINGEFSGEAGGTITSDSGTTGQKETNLKRALWIDYSNTVGGETEGVSMFQWPDGEPRKWLTREYGTFGPRRPDHQSGKPFTLKHNERLSQRVGIYVHGGDVESGDVAEMYEKYVNGGLN